MKLKNILLASTPFLLNCSDMPTAPRTLLKLEDYTCTDESCTKLDKRITNDSLRPLRFVSVASYRGVQNYRWDINWKENLPDGRVVDAKVWIEADQQNDYTTITWDLRTAPKVEYTLSVKVLDQTKTRRWKPIDSKIVVIQQKSYETVVEKLDIEKIIEVPPHYKINSQTIISNPKKR